MRPASPPVAGAAVWDASMVPPSSERKQCRESGRGTNGIILLDKSMISGLAIRGSGTASLGVRVDMSPGTHT